MNATGTRGGMTAWVAGPPSARNDSALLVFLVEDVLRLLKPYGIGLLLSSEPKTYGPSDEGLRLLAESLAEGRIDGISLGSQPSRLQGPGYGCADLDFGQATYPSEMAVRIGVRIRPFQSEDVASVGESLTTFARSWFARLGAAAAFVSASWMVDGYMVGDSDSRTSHEAVHGLPSLTLWPDLCRFARGAFWGMGLGHDLCERLGGRERVLGEAPALVAEPLATGAWLQLSGVPPADPVEIERLRGFLAPVLNWSLSDTLHGKLFAPAGRARELVPNRGSQRIESTTPKRVVEGFRIAVPTRFLRQLSSLEGVSIHFDSPPTREQSSTIEALVADWYRQGFNGGFGGAGLHSISGPIVEGSVLRWLVDFGDVDVRQAGHALARILGQLKGIRVARLVFGTEQAAKPGDS